MITGYHMIRPVVRLNNLVLINVDSLVLRKFHLSIRKGEEAIKK